MLAEAVVGIFWVVHRMVLAVAREAAPELEACPMSCGGMWCLRYWRGVGSEFWQLWVFVFGWLLDWAIWDFSAEIAARVVDEVHESDHPVKNKHWHFFSPAVVCSSSSCGTGHTTVELDCLPDSHSLYGVYAVSRFIAWNPDRCPVTDRQSCNFFFLFSLAFSPSVPKRQSRRRGFGE